MKPFTFPAWVELSPSHFVLQFGPYAAGVADKPKIAYKAAARVAAELDERGPYWRASVPFLEDGERERRELPKRFASADDAKLAAEQAIIAAGDGRYTLPLPHGTYSIRADGTLFHGGQPIDAGPAFREGLSALCGIAQYLAERAQARAASDKAGTLQ